MQANIPETTQESLADAQRALPEPADGQYLDLIRDILENGEKREDRTGTGTLSVFGRQLRFSLRENQFPLLTTKRVFWRGVVEELLWFIRGSTNANELAAKKVHIWDGHGSRAFLDKTGKSLREEGDLGPIYGFQWRHWGAKYKDMHTDYSGQGFDQLAEAIRLIKTDPNSRRILILAWNVEDLYEMALPPCHVLMQFYVGKSRSGEGSNEDRRELSCMMYQRSGDVGLGVPFNIASYSLLLRMIAQVCGLDAGDFVYSLGDAHIYLDHVDALSEQLQRTPRSSPTLAINPEKLDIDAFVPEDFTIENYDPHGPLTMKMSV